MEAKKIDFRALEQQRTLALQKQLKTRLQARQVAKDSSLRREVLSCVVEAQYEDASRILDDFMETKHSFQSLLQRADPHVHHAKDLINAIRLKRDFPNLSHLAISKQQEILDHAVGHFEELKMTVKMIEHISREEMVRDLRSTIWVVRCLIYVAAAILVTAFVVAFCHGLKDLSWRVFNNYTNVLFEKLSHLF